VIYGLGASVLWGPYYCRYWERRYNLVRHEWTRLGTTDFYVVKTQNPYFKSVMRRNAHTGEIEKVNIYKGTWYYWGLYTAIFFVSLFCLLIMTYGVTAFVSLWLYWVELPSCADCEANFMCGKVGGKVVKTSVYPPNYKCDGCGDLFCTDGSFDPDKGTGIGADAVDACSVAVDCFNSYNQGVFTVRWTFILFQGIMLGISIDILLTQFFIWFCEKITQLENIATLEEYHKQARRSSAEHLIATKALRCTATA